MELVFSRQDSGSRRGLKDFSYFHSSRTNIQPAQAELFQNLKYCDKKPVMRLTNFTDFGLRALILLADRHPEILSATVIADHHRVSRHHMAKVLQHLTANGFLEGVRGAQGGVRLARDPRDIRIGDVVRVLDDQPLVECFSDQGSDCALLPRCRLKGMLARAQQAFLRELDRYALSDCLEKSAPFAALGLNDPD